MRLAATSARRSFSRGSSHPLGVDDHRHADGDPLIAAARVDDHRQRAAAHPRVAARRGPCAGLQGDRGGVEAVEQDASDLRAVGMLQPLLADGHVIFDLRGQNWFNLRDGNGVGEFKDIPHRQEGPVPLLAKLLLRDLPLGQDVFSVLFHPGDISMGVLDFHKRRMAAAPDLRNDVEGGDILNQLAGAEALAQAARGSACGPRR